MKGYIVHEFGGPENMLWETLPRPEPGPGQLLVEVHASGMNFAETRMRAGTYSGQPLPFVMGMEVLAQATMIYDPQRGQVQFIPHQLPVPTDGQFSVIKWHDRLIDGTINEQPAKLRVDTGSTTMLLIPENKFDDFFPGEDLATFGGAINASGVQKSSVGVRNVEVSVEGRKLTGRAKRVSKREGAMDGKLGWRFFNSAYTIFDYRGNVILMRDPHEIGSTAHAGAKND